MGVASARLSASFMRRVASSSLYWSSLGRDAMNPSKPPDPPPPFQQSDWPLPADNPARRTMQIIADYAAYVPPDSYPYYRSIPHALRASIKQPLPPEHSFYAVIGRVVAEFAQVEHILDLAIWDLCAADQLLASCITGQLLGQSGRFLALQELADAKGFDKAMWKRIETLKSGAAILFKRRNRFVHDAWYETGVGQTGQFRSYSGKEGVFGFHEVTSADAEKIIVSVKKMAAVTCSPVCPRL